MPEKFGVDFLIHSRAYGLVGVQRKELSDLISSTRDGRLARELVLMKQLPVAILLLEGRLQYTNDGTALLQHSTWTRAQHFGLIWSVQNHGYWVASVETQSETSTYLTLLTNWVAKERHGSLLTRPKASTSSIWGKADEKDFAVHLLQSFPGVGLEVARAIYDHFGGVPVQWTVTEEQLRQVKGVGKGRAKALIESLGKQGGQGKSAPSPSLSSSTTAQSSANSSPPEEFVFTELMET